MFDLGRVLESVWRLNVCDVHAGGSCFRSAEWKSSVLYGLHKLQSVNEHYERESILSTKQHLLLSPWRRIKFKLTVGYVEGNQWTNMLA